MRFLATGGYFDDSGECTVFVVDTAREFAAPWLRYRPPEHLRVPTKGFAGGSLGPDGRSLFIAAHAFVARVDIASGQVEGVLHQPSFNDLHHVAVDRRGGKDRILVANTGLGTVDVFTGTGRFLGSHSLVPPWVNSRRMAGGTPSDWEAALSPGWNGLDVPPWLPQDDPTDRYHTPSAAWTVFHRSKVPDYLHPNHICPTPGCILVTCLYDGSVRDAQSFDVLARLEGRFPHDGQVRDGLFWMTTIDGLVLALAMEGGVPTDRIVEQRSVFTETGCWGWCRGLHVTPDHLVVGLTEVRRGRLPRHRWADLEPEGSMTAILVVERQTGRLVSRTDLTESERHSKIYSLIPLE